MFGFLEDIEKLTSLPFELLKNGFRIINFCNKCVYVENFKNIVLFEPENISIKLPKGMLTILGKNLKLSKLNVSSIVINGEIESLKVD